jgi:hypothetical protein
MLAQVEGLFDFGIFSLLFWGQVLFYAASLLGWFLENRQIRLKVLFIPYYFFIMNLSVFLGFARYLKGSQSVNWERAKRGGATSEAVA